MVTSAKDVVATSVTGVVGLAQRGRRWSGELRRSMSQAMDMVLGKSEELVDHFLPMTEDELGTDQRGLGLARGCTAQHRKTWDSNQVRSLPPLCAQKTGHRDPKDTWGFCMATETALSGLQMCGFISCHLLPLF